MPFTTGLEAMPEEGAPTKPRVILCSNVLPVILSKDKDTGKWTAEFDEDSLFEDGPLFVSLRGLDYDVMHVGVPQTFIPDEEREVVEPLLNKMNCYPVWCDAKRAHNHFQGYCKGILWPTFHNVIDLYSRLEPQAILGKRYTRAASNGVISSDDDLDVTESSRGAQGADKAWKPARSWSPMEAETCWPDYCAMNGLFARKVVEIYSHGDIIWVHDYHLLLLPSYLLRKLTNARIALFLHVPFPSSEIFRTLATREEILRAMLCADHLGFDLYEYARHFITCCSRMLGLSHSAKRGGVLTVNNNGREVSITCSHVGVNLRHIQQQLHSPQVQSLAQRISSTLLYNDRQLADAAGGAMNSVTSAHSGESIGQRRQLIIAIDEVEGLRGLGLKLLALDRLFTDYPHLRDRVVLKQIGLKLDSRPDDYKQCHDEVMGLIKLIREKWGPVVEYEERSQILMADRLSLFQNADVYLSTAIRVGVDMIPFEYLLSRRNPAGCVILSEFSACSRVLHGALRVNPFKTSALAATIEEALSMSVAERTARCSRDLEFIERNPILEWADRILKDVMDAHKDVSEPLAKYGGGFGTRIIASFGQQVKKQNELDNVAFSEAFKSSRSRLILVDYSGTLVETSSLNMYMKRGGTARTWHYEKGGSRRPGGCLETRDPISDSARAALIELCRDPANIVVVISSDLRAELAHALEGIPNLALIAENGFVFRFKPTSGWVPAVDSEHDGGGDWYGGNSAEGFYYGAPEGGADGDSVGESSEGASVPEDYPEAHDEMANWQEMTMKMMKNYSGRTNGSFVWQSPSAVSFNFVLSDPELGLLQASNLVLELEQALAVMPLTVEQGKGFVTVRLRGVNRGTAIRELMSYINHRTANTTPIDFVACFGDDTEDESSFHATNKYTLGRSKKVETFSVRVGASQKSKAKYFVSHPDDVVESLQELVKASSSGKVRRNFSAGDFRTQEGSNILGHFKTKQSFITLSQAENSSSALNLAGYNEKSPSGPNETFQAQSISPSMSGMRHSPSYVASDREMDEMFGGGSGPAAALPPSLPMEGAFDPRSIPPTNSSDVDDEEEDEETDGMDGVQRNSYDSSENDDEFEEDREYLHSNPIPLPSNGVQVRHADGTSTTYFTPISGDSERENSTMKPNQGAEGKQPENEFSGGAFSKLVESEWFRMGIAALSGAAFTLAILRRTPQTSKG